MPSTVDRVLREARSHLGYDEGSNNDTKFGRWYGMNHVPWCAQYVSYVAAFSGATDIIPKHAYTPSGAAWFKARKQWGSRPRKGAVVYYEFPGMGRISHVGIVEAVHSDGSITALEGNTNRAGSRTGGSVLRKRRGRSLVAGYGYPAYVSERRLAAIKAAAVKRTADAKRKAARKAAALAAVAVAAAAAAVAVTATRANDPSPKPKATASPAVTPSPRPSATRKPAAKTTRKPVAKPAAKPYVLRRVLAQGASGGDVTRAQRLVGLRGGAVDGQFGRATTRAVRAWQRRHDLRPDGQFGRQSARKAGWIWTRTG